MAVGVGSPCANAMSFGSAERVGAALEPSGGVWAQGNVPHLSDAIRSANNVPGGHSGGSATLADAVSSCVVVVTVDAVGALCCLSLRGVSGRNGSRHG